MPRLPHLHLHRILVDGQALPLVVNGRSQAAVRDHFLERHVRIERLSPEEAFQAGVRGALIETIGEHTTPSESAQSAPKASSEPGLFDDTGIPAATTDHADATSRLHDGPGPGYAAALSEAASL